MDAKQTLQHYLERGRTAARWKLQGLSDYDVRRPMTPTGTNLLGLVKHLACCEFGYLGAPFGRPPGVDLPWWSDSAEFDADLYATAEESRDWVLDFYDRATAHSDATIAALDLDSPGVVEWWPADRRAVTLHRVLVHLIDETSRHAGHMDILRELIDGSAGLRPDVSNLPAVSEDHWPDRVAMLERIARQA